MFGFSKNIVVAFVALTAVQASVMPEAAVEKRQIDSIISQITSGAASIATHDVPGLVSSATSAFGKATSVAASIGNVITSDGAGFVEYVTSEAGKEYTVITSIGGQGFTLATSGAGVATSEFGSIYTVATAAVSSAVSSHNAGASSLSMTSSLFVGFATVICSALVGAVITL